MILGYDNKTNWTMWEMQQFRNMKNCDGSEVSFCYATKSYFVISILSRDWFLSDTSNLGTLSPFTNAFFFWILTARGYARGRGYAPSITSDRTSGWHATFGEESGKSVARSSSLWVDICVARCVKQCQIRRNQSKRSLIDYLTMLSGSKAAFRTNFLQERSAKNGNLLNYGTLFFLLDSGTSLTCIKKIRLISISVQRETRTIMARTSLYLIDPHQDWQGTAPTANSKSGEACLSSFIWS